MIRLKCCTNLRTMSEMVIYKNVGYVEAAFNVVSIMAYV